MMTVTLDTNSFFDYFERGKTQVLDDLLRSAEKGCVDIAKTTRVQLDTFDRARAQGRDSKIWQEISEFPNLKTIGTAFRLDVSRLDSEDYLVDENYQMREEEITKLLLSKRPKGKKGNLTADVDHLLGHIGAERDYFVTSDPDFLNARGELKNGFSVNILTPEEVVQVLQEDKA